MRESLIDGIRHRFESATQGPYEHDNGSLSQHWSVPGEYTEIVTTYVDCLSYCYGGSCAGIIKAEDAEFLAESWNDMKQLLELLDAIRQIHSPVADSASALYPVPLCTCGQSYPCATMQLLNE